MVLVVLLMVLSMLVVLKGLAQIHLHRITLVLTPTVQHDIMGLVSMALIEHAELLG